MPAELPHAQVPAPRASSVRDQVFIGKLSSFENTIRSDTWDSATLEKNFWEKFDALNRANLKQTTDRRDCAHQPREAILRSPSAVRDNSSGLLHGMLTPDVFSIAEILSAINDIVREEGSPLNFTVLNIAETQKLRALKTCKKGLMQQLFSSSNSDQLHFNLIWSQIK